MIREATLADASAIGALQLRAWLRAYEDIVDGSVLAGYDVAGRAARWEGILADDAVATLVAEVGGRICGFVTVGAGRGEGAGTHEGEVRALYVDPPAQGAGQGGHLLVAGEDALRDRGCSTAILWVFRDNGHARGFYEGRGWSFVEGSEREDDWAVEVQYERSL